MEKKEWIQPNSFSFKTIRTFYILGSHHFHWDFVKEARLWGSCHIVGELGSCKVIVFQLLLSWMLPLKCIKLPIIYLVWVPHNLLLQMLKLKSLSSDFSTNLWFYFLGLYFSLWTSDCDCKFNLLANFICIPYLLVSLRELW